MELIPRAVADAAWERRARALEAINTAAAVKKKPKKLRRTMSILRHGNFRVKPIGDAHCGIDLGNARIEANYFVRVECVPTLDHRGFLFEHGLFGNGAPSADIVGIEFPDGSVLGDKGNVKFRWTDAFMALAADGKL